MPLVDFATAMRGLVNDVYIWKCCNYCDKKLVRI